MNSLTHVFLTRYNLPSGGQEQFIRAREGWLQSRTELFARYTVPSVRAQKAPHSWIVYLDPESPQWLLEYMHTLNENGTLTPVLRETVSHSELVGDIERVTGWSGGRLITTNLDNDDGLAIDFSAIIQTAAEQIAAPAALYVTHGLILADHKLYLRRDPLNAFCSVLDEGSMPRTCWIDWHNRLPRHMPVVQIGESPGWLQVVHGSNVSNRVRGRRTSPRGHLTRFPDTIDDAEPASRAVRIADALLGAPYRLTRDRGRSAGRDFIVRVAGKDGLDLVKARLARARAQRSQ